MVKTALDFLFVQAYKAHDAVAILAAEGLVEDGSTVTRRLLELGIQAVYIGADSEPLECQSRAGRFLAFLWREANSAAKDLLTPEVRAYWGDIDRQYGHLIDPKAKRWGPSLRDMFKYAELDETYTEDYALLSRIAHGGPEEFILQYARETFRLRSTLHLPVTLLFASRYYVGVFDIWNRHFRIADEAVIEELLKRLGDSAEWEGDDRAT